MNVFEINSGYMKRYYSILGIRPASGLEDIKSAYRKLAKTVHPDMGGDPMRFRDIKEAYETLCDPVKRHDYDRRLSALPFNGEPYKCVEATILSEPVDVYDDIVDVLGRRMGMEMTSRIKGTIPVTADDARDGVNLEITLPVEVICQHCFGFGGTIISKCRNCGGKGMIAVRRMVHLRIEPGASDGNTIVGFSGKTKFSGVIRIQR